MKGKVNGNGNLLAFGSNPLTETKVEVIALNMIEQLFQLFVKCLLGCFVHWPYKFFGGWGFGGAGWEEMQKIAKLTIFAIHPCQCFDVMVKETQLNKTTIATATNVCPRLTCSHRLLVTQMGLFRGESQCRF